MATKSTLFFFIIIFPLTLLFLISIQQRMKQPPLPEPGTTHSFSLQESFTKRWATPRSHYYNCPKDRPPLKYAAVVNVTDIKRVLTNSRHGSVVLFLQSILEQAIPDGCHIYDRYGNEEIYLYWNKTVTIFVPPIKALFNNDANLKYQMVQSKIEEEDFDSGYLPIGAQLYTVGYDRKVSITQHQPPSINYARIVEWNIYNDGYVIIHRVDNYFISDDDYSDDVYVISHRMDDSLTSDSDLSDYW